MAKSKSRFVCQECGYESMGWMGKCPDCGAWSSIVEERIIAPVVQSARAKAVGFVAGSLTPQLLSEVEMMAENRVSSGIPEFDRVLGGGIVRGSLVLIGGAPGSGKSTLLLQISNSFQGNVLYISGEESLPQIKMRADRLNVKNVLLQIASTTDFPSVRAMIENVRPDYVIIDSIQTMYEPEFNGAPGSVGQVKEITLGLMNIAKTANITIFIVGHLTKDGAIAGPRVLEHMVDTVLYFEGDKNQNYRILRAAKNRFGSTNELGIFEMREAGLVPVNNPSAYMLNGRPEHEPGSVVICGVEGSMPMLIEIQALVTPSVYEIPRRMATGIDYNRVILITAVLERKLGYFLGKHDIYVNVIGGIKVDEPAADLGIAIAIASSYSNTPIDAHTVVLGEIGLTGEIRSINAIEKRLREISQMGFKTCVIPEGNKDGIKSDVKIISAKNLASTIETLL